MKKLFTLATAFAVSVGIAANAQGLGEGVIVSGVEDGASYTTYQTEVVITWGVDNLVLDGEGETKDKFFIHFDDYAFPDQPDDWSISGNASIVSVNRGTKNAVKLTFDSYTSSLDYSNFFGPRLTKYGEFTLTVPEGLVKSLNGEVNAEQEIFWKQVETLGEGIILSGVEDGATYTTYQTEVILTWGVNNLVFAGESETKDQFYIHFDDYAFPDQPDDWSVKGNGEIVSVDGGTHNAVLLTFDSYTSSLDYSNLFGPRLTKYGEFTLTIPEGLVMGPNGEVNPEQEIFWKQVETIEDKPSGDLNPVVTGTVDNVTPFSATITFTPNEDVESYYVLCCLGSVEQYFSVFGGWMGFQSPVEMIISWGWYEYTGVQTITFDEDIIPGNQYEVGIAVIGTDGNYVPYQSVSFTTPSGSTPEDNYWYISGAMNDYDPAFSDDWALMDDDSNPGIYTGTFTIADASEFRFNLMKYDGVYFVPFDMDYMDAMPVTLDFTSSHSFFGNCMAAFDEEEEWCFWNCPSWNGGMITISVDTNTGNFPTVEIYAFPAQSDFNEDYTIYPLDENGITSVLWEGGNIDSVWRESGEITLAGSDGTVITLERVVSGKEGGQVSILDGPSFGIEIDLTSLDLAAGKYTINIPAKFIQVVSNDWEDFLYNPEIIYTVTVGETGILGINGDEKLDIYTLQGVKINVESLKELNNGIYLINGKKVVIRK
ncbi:MAG: hypothetical protein J1E95_01115 [Muribaculaceae bacterium]|nr:hypothetical protein [Muribaculaceae bacterium]